MQWVANQNRGTPSTEFVGGFQFPQTCVSLLVYASFTEPTGLIETLCRGAPSVFSALLHHAYRTMAKHLHSFWQGSADRNDYNTRRSRYSVRIHAATGLPEFVRNFMDFFVLL
jgi:hypothetical protein